MIEIAILLLVAAALALALLSRRRAPGTTDREWEELLLLHVLGGHRAIQRGLPCPDHRDAMDRALDVRGVAEALAAGGVLPMPAAEAVVSGAFARLLEKGEACQPRPPEQAPEGSLPDPDTMLLTPKGAREAQRVWEREAARLAAMAVPR